MHRHSLFSLASVLALTVAAPGCAEREAPADDVDPRVLVDFESCDDLLGYAKSNAKNIVEEYGNPWGYPEDDGGFFEGGDTGAAGSGGEGGDPSGDSGDGGGEDVPQGDNGGGKDFSGTNVQEAGVDEPDLIKTDGERILALAQGSLHFVDVSGASPVKRGSLALGGDAWDAQMFLHEDRALLLVRTGIYNYGEGEGVYDEAFPFPEEEPAPAPGLDLSKHFPKNTGSLLRLIEVDISDPDALRIVSNLYISGDLVNARLIEGVARVVLRSAPTGLEFKSPYDFLNWDAIEPGVPSEGGGSGVDTSTTGANPTTETSTSGTSGMSTSTGGDGQPAPEGDAPAFREGQQQTPWEIEWAKARMQAKLYNLAVIESSTADDWLPHFVLEDLSGGQAVITAGRLLDCVDVAHPGTYSGLSTLSVLTVDLAQSLALGKGIGVFAEGETVYASTDNLYVTTTPWRPQLWTEQDVQDGLTSYVHKFSLASAEKAKYVASGAVRGQVRSQWSLSEHAGDLRIATTDQQAWDSATSESFVSVLRQTGDELQQIGQVGDLGKGEQIQGVRFIGGAGYVVTFRQTDPLYAIDLSDPTKPLTLGELKIPGYSAYLHPIADGQLLGVGFDGTEEGDLTGLQLSLFDVSNLAAPKRIHSAPVGEAFGWSEAVFDHHAFLYWGKSKLALLPVESYSWDEVNDVESSFSGALGYTVDAQAGILPVGEIQHALEAQPDEFGWTPPIRRSLVIGEQVLTLSDIGLKASALGDLSDVAWIEF